MSTGENNKTSSFVSSRRKRVVLILDPFSSAKFLVNNLLLRGKDLLCLLTDDVNKRWSAGFSKSHFVEVLDYRDFQSDVVKFEMFLRPRYSVYCVIPGGENAVLAADEISFHLKIRIHNVFELSICRRDKYAMHMRLQDCGIRYINQKKCTNSTEALKFARSIGYPCVCKPARASGTKGVYKCLKDNDVLAAACSIFAFSDVTLCQEYLAGTEYVFDTVSYNGIHIPSMIYQYEKNSESLGFAYVNTVPVPFDNNLTSLTYRLYTYIRAVLNALGIQNGPAHAEVIMTDSGPCLVEIGARMHGLLGPYVAEKAASLECSQHFLSGDAYVNRGKFLRRKYKQWNQRWQHGFLPYDIKKFCIWHHFQVSQTMGVLARDIEETAEPLLSSLQTTQKTNYHMFKNDKLRKTRDMATLPGGVLLVGDEKQVQRDYKQVIEWERSGMLWDVRKWSANNSVLRYACSYGHVSDTSGSDTIHTDSETEC